MTTHFAWRTCCAPRLKPRRGEQLPLCVSRDDDRCGWRVTEWNVHGRRYQELIAPSGRVSWVVYKKVECDVPSK